MLRGTRRYHRRQNGEPAAGRPVPHTGSLPYDDKVGSHRSTETSSSYRSGLAGLAEERHDWLVPLERS